MGGGQSSMPAAIFFGLNFKFTVQSNECGTRILC